jgi:hypothetical protein
MILGIVEGKALLKEGVREEQFTNPPPSIIDKRISSLELTCQTVQAFHSQTN